MNNSNLYSIETVSGRYVDMLRPDISAINLEDIAWSLSRTSRFVGHTINEVPYNNAQHSILVANILSDWYSGKYPSDPRISDKIRTIVERTIPHFAFQNKYDDVVLALGLLHDASEAYFGDVPSPAKNLPLMRSIINTHSKAFDSYLFARYGLLHYFTSLVDLEDFFTSADTLYGRYSQKHSHFSSGEDEALFVSQCNIKVNSICKNTRQIFAKCDDASLPFEKQRCTSDFVWITKMADLFAQVIEAWCFAADRGNVWIKRTPQHQIDDSDSLAVTEFGLSITEFQNYVVYPETAKESFTKMMNMFNNNDVFIDASVVDFSEISRPEGMQ